MNMKEKKSIFFKQIKMINVEPRPCGTSLKDGELGFPIYFLVGFPAFLLDVALNVALTSKPSPLLCHKSNSNPFWFLLSLSFLLSLTFTLFCVCQPYSHSSYLPFYSLPLVGIQIITFASIPTQFHLYPKSQGNWFLLRIPLKLITNTK